MKKLKSFLEHLKVILILTIFVMGFMVFFKFYLMFIGEIDLFFNENAFSWRGVYILFCGSFAFSCVTFFVLHQFGMYEYIED